MKERKKEIAKIIKNMLIPFINVFMVLIVSVAFAKPVSEGGRKWENEKGNVKNEKMITVYFHNSDEVKEVELEEYLLGVVPAEMPPSFEKEALKAQAVAARTFIVNREIADNSEHKGALVCTDSNHCKAYVSENERIDKWGNEWKEKYEIKIRDAVYSTKGEIVTYDGEPISAVFHSTSSGRTENSEDVWQTQLPYLKSVESEGENKSPRYTSSETFSYEDFRNRILSVNSNADLSGTPSSWFGNKTYNESGSVKTITIGGVIFKGTEIRSMFNLRSTNFNITTDGNIVFNVVGNGHGVGMSQYGANYAAQNGYTYDMILKKYYQGTEISKM